MKTDQSIKNIVVAAIRRHSIDMHTWVHTRLWDEGAPEVRSEFLQACDFAPGEIPILYSYINASAWTLVTTRRVCYRSDGGIGTVAAADVVEHRAGNFKGYGKQEVERMTIRSRDGVAHSCPFETGKASMGTIYAVQVLCRIAPAA